MVYFKNLVTQKFKRFIETLIDIPRVIVSRESGISYLVVLDPPARYSLVCQGDPIGVALAPADGPLDI